MKRGITRSSDIADFYQQLALLTRARLPLPESLRNLANNLPSAAFRNAVSQMSEHVASGKSFSSTLSLHGEFFNPLQCRIIAAAETTGTLSETLFVVARLARFCQFAVSRLKEIVAYPLLTIHMAFLIVFFLSTYVFPEFRAVVQDLVGPEWKMLPLSTRVVMTVAAFINEHYIVVGTVYVAFLVFSLWLFTPGVLPQRVLLGVIHRLPFCGEIMRSLDASRICGMWATLFRQGLPFHEAAMAASEVVEDAPLRAALRRVSDSTRGGKMPGKALEEEACLDPLITLTLNSAAEEDLSDEFYELGEMFEHRLTLSVRTAAELWTVLSLVVAAVVVGTVVMAIFQPMVSIVRMCSM